MPCVSQFYGVSIYFYYNDHHPPYFHARYGDEEGVFSIDHLDMMQGYLPRRARGLVEEWAGKHGAELMADWNLARAGQPLVDIAPLD